MNLTGSIPVLACNNIDESLDFYQQALQFVIINQRKSQDRLQWVYLRSGDVVLMLESCDADAAAGSSRLYLYTDDVQRMHHYLKAKGYRPGSLRLTPYDMQEFDISDPAGHRLTIGQRVTEKQYI